VSGVWFQGSGVPAYDVQGLRFRYAHRGEQDSPWVLAGLTFQVTAGEILGVIGPNGSGKTSLLKLLAKVLKPQEGVMRLFGQVLEDMSQAAVARSAALVPSESHQTFPFTVAETVLMGRFPHRRKQGPVWGFGWETAEDLALAERAMTEMDVAALRDRPLSEVSGGERQRALIARALTQEPRILLLDEPTAFLDLHHQLEICEILCRLRAARGLTVVLVSHDLNLASQYCDRLLLLQQGTVSRLGTPDEVIREEVLGPIYPT
jgi:iron complex transport system ATP-binding protein